jgi:hypothetical protein
VSSADQPGTDHDRNAPPPPASQYVGSGTAVLGAQAHCITIYNSSMDYQVPWTSGVAPTGPAPGQSQTLGRLRRLTSGLLVLASRLHTAAEALAGLSLHTGSSASSSCTCSSRTSSEADRLRRDM